jgi:polyhydroxyalkanoate synthesis regulator protein
MFQKAFTMFAPFARREGQAAEADKSPTPAGEIDELKNQLVEMQKRLDRLTSSDKPEADKLGNKTGS